MNSAKGQICEQEAVEPKLIPLTKGQWAMVDAADFEWMSQWKWQAWWCKETQSYYAIRRVVVDGRRTEYKMARMILGLVAGNPLVADHANHNTLDNRRSNLRPATRKENAQNRRNRKDSKVGLKGVSQCKDGRWRARICVDGKNIDIGQSFQNAEAAHAAYRVAAREYFGEFAHDC